MINNHYNGLVDITDYWSVGDVRVESIVEIPSGTTEESQPSQDIELMIIGMNHDDNENGGGKTAVTLQTKDQLSTVGFLDKNYTSKDHSLWSTSPRRTWCNNDFKSALPTWLQNLIKPVVKITNRYCSNHVSGYNSYRDQTSTIDEVFFLSEFETFGCKTDFTGEDIGDVGSDGTQYEYMKTQSNRVKNGPSNYYYTRSCVVNNAAHSHFLMVSNEGTSLIVDTLYAYGLSPAFCL